MEDSDLCRKLKGTGKSGIILSKDYGYFLKLKQVDGEMACVRARRIVERICRKYYKGYLNEEAGTQPLANICDKLRKHVPKRIMAQISMIQHYGNLGAHGEEDDIIAVASEDAVLSVAELDRIGDSLEAILAFFAENAAAVLGEESASETDLRIKRGKELSADELEAMFALGRAVYGAEVVPDSSGFHARHKANPDIYFAIFDHNANRCIGFLGAVPLARDGFLKTIAESFDSEIPPEDIASYDFPDMIYLHLSTVVVDPAYRDHSMAYKKMLDAFVRFLVELADRDIFVLEISADAISSFGNRICTSLGMQKRHERPNSTLYHSTLLPPALRLHTNDGTRLIRFYKKKYEDLKDMLPVP